MAVVLGKHELCNLIIQCEFGERWEIRGPFQYLDEMVKDWHAWLYRKEQKRLKRYVVHVKDVRGGYVHILAREIVAMCITVRDQ